MTMAPLPALLPLTWELPRMDHPRLVIYADGWSVSIVLLCLTVVARLSTD